MHAFWGGADANSVPSEFCCEPKTALEKIRSKKMNHFVFFLSCKYIF